MMKPFYIHKQTPGGKFNGFTARIEPASDPRAVNVMVAFCSRKDNFVKAIGRNVAEQQGFTQINKRYLPEFLGQLYAKSWGEMNPKGFGELFNYVLKYVV